jgi:hypothetical protein
MMRWIAACMVAAAALAAQAQPAAAPPQLKVFRYAFPIAETGFDPATISDLYSRIVTDLAYSSLIVYRRSPFWLDWWQYVDIDVEAQKKMAKR